MEKKENVFLMIANHIEEGILCVTFTVMAVVCFVQVITRYFLHFSLPWSEELLRGLFVWSSCLGISLGFKTKSHLGVDAIVNLFPAKFRKVLALLAYLVVIFFCVLVVFYSIQITAKQFATGQKTIALRMPICYVSAALPIGFSLTIIRILQVMAGDYRADKNNAGDGADGEMHISEGLL